MLLSTALSPHPCPAPRSVDAWVVARGVLLLLAAALAASVGDSDGNSEPALSASSRDGHVGGANPTGASMALSGMLAVDASTSCEIPGFQAELLQRVNTARATARRCGANAMPAAATLIWNARLFSAAAGHSRDMARNDYFSHTSQDGLSMGERVSDEGYAWKAVGENIAAGQSSVSSVMATWLSSPGHCANIMSPIYTHVAVSCVYQPGSTYGSYWTMVLAKP